MKLVLTTFLAIAFLVSHASAQNKNCGPNSVKCTIHHEGCKC
jgi:hypothetical protein